MNARRMGTRKWAAAAATVVALAVPALPAGAGARAPVPGDALVVKLADGRRALPAVAGAVDAEVATAVTPSTYVLEVPPGDATAALRRLRSDRRVEWVEREVAYRATVTPNDPCYSGCSNPVVRQWNMARVRAPEAWDVTRGGAEVVVAVLDTGVDAAHADLAGKIIVGGVYSGTSTAADVDGHGTHVAGTIAAATDNGRGVAGMGWHTKVLSIKVLDDTGWGTSSGIAQGIYEAVSAGVEVINLSLGGDYSKVVADAVATARAAGILVVAAAGNDGTDVPQYPAALDGVVAVAATDADDKVAAFSNRGTWVDIAAPGTSIVSTTPGNTYALMDGTSMASPLVAAAGALTLASSPGISADDVASRLTATSVAITGTGTLVRHGRLDAGAAVVQPAPAPAPAPTTTTTTSPTTTSPTTTSPTTSPVPAPVAAPVAVVASRPDGYWLVGEDGGVFSFGQAAFHGSTGNLRLNRPIVGMTGRAAGGYWFVAGDGGIFAFGAPFFGSTGALRLNRPIVGMAATPSGNGYWLVASDGGIFAFGDARFFGSTGALRLNRPIVGMSPTPSGNGYWLVASDGGIFAFGDAGFFGSTGALTLNRPITGMAATRSGRGYWFVASDGGVFAFGDARFHGAGVATPAAVVGMTASAGGNGYRLVAADGSVAAYGDATRHGSLAGAALRAPVVGMATP